MEFKEALKNYDHISNSDTSLISDMSGIFEAKKNLNDDINNWDVSKISRMVLFINIFFII